VRSGPYDGEKGRRKKAVFPAPKTKAEKKGRGRKVEVDEKERR